MYVCIYIYIHILKDGNLVMETGCTACCSYEACGWTRRSVFKYIYIYIYIERDIYI